MRMDRTGAAWKDVIVVFQYTNQPFNKGRSHIRHLCSQNITSGSSRQQPTQRFAALLLLILPSVAPSFSVAQWSGHVVPLLCFFTATDSQTSSLMGSLSAFLSWIVVIMFSSE